MVTRETPTKKSPKARRGTLTKKLFRDMGRSAMQFLAMFLLCALGTWVFTGLDANWRLLENSTETYYDEYNLSDFWVKGASFSRQDLTRLKAIDGVEPQLVTHAQVRRVLKVMLAAFESDALKGAPVPFDEEK